MKKLYAIMLMAALAMAPAVFSLAGETGGNAGVPAQQPAIEKGEKGPATVSAEKEAPKTGKKARQTGKRGQPFDGEGC